MSPGARPSRYGLPLALAAIAALSLTVTGCSGLGGGVMSGSGAETATVSSGATASPAAAVSAPVAKTGDRVAAPWNGDMYIGSVTAVNGESADVLYDDDNVNREVPLADLVVVAAREWKPGDKVMAVWTAGRFAPGIVAGPKAPGIYTVKWDDDTLSDVEASKIYGR